MGKSMAEKNAPMIRAAISKAEIDYGDEILEVGFGNGAHVPQILKTSGMKSAVILLTVRLARS